MGYKRFGYDGPKEFCPLSAWEYLGYSIVFMIPVIGWAILVYSALSSSNINRRSYARSYLLAIFIFLLLLILAGGAIYAYCMGPQAQRVLRTLNAVMYFL